MSYEYNCMFCINTNSKYYINNNKYSVKCNILNNFYHLYDLYNIDNSVFIQIVNILNQINMYTSYINKYIIDEIINIYCNSDKIYYSYIIYLIYRLDNIYSNLNNPKNKLLRDINAAVNKKLKRDYVLIIIKRLQNKLNNIILLIKDTLKTNGKYNYFQEKLDKFNIKSDEFLNDENITITKNYCYFLNKKSLKIYFHYYM